MTQKINQVQIWVYLGLLLLLFPPSVLSQNGDVFFHELNIGGVPFDTKTNVIHTDSFGFLWIGTDNGLYRYDGNALLEFQYDVFDERSIPNNSVGGIIEDHNQNLWIATESYLVLYERERNIFHRYYKDNAPTLLGKSGNGEIWVNLKNDGLLRIRPNKEVDRTIFHADFDYGKEFWSLKYPFWIGTFLEDAFGRRWISSPQGIYEVNGTGHVIPTNFRMNTRILKDVGNNTFLAATDEGIFVIGYNKADRQLEILESYRHFLRGKDGTPEAPTSIALGSEAGSFWVGTTGGLFRADRKNNRYRFTHFGSDRKKKGALSNNQITSTTVDRFGNLWVGNLKGVNQLIGRNSIFEYGAIEHPGYAGNAFVRSLLPRKKFLWMGLNQNGLYRYDLKTGMAVNVFPTSRSINFISPDFENREILINAGDALLRSRDLRHDPSRIRFDTLKQYKKPVQDAFYLNGNELWVGLWTGGVDILNPTNGLTDFKKRVVQRMGNNNTSVLLRDSRENVWVGTRGTGLFRVDLLKEEIHQFLPSRPDGLTSNAILCLLEDEQREFLWIGTRGGGLHKYDYGTKKFTPYGKERGLLSSTVAAIEQDEEGNLWLSTRNGLARFDVTEERFTTFGREDGIAENYFSFNASTVKRAGGNIYFGCRDGFYEVRTGNFRQSAQEPKTVITSFAVLGESMKDAAKRQDQNLLFKGSDVRSSFILPYEDNHIAFEFSSLDLTAPAKNEYAYMLEGINDYWIYTKGADQTTNYNDLPPGDYVFKVKGTNSDGVWNEDFASLAFRIERPLWFSNWAIAIYVLLGLLVLLASYLLIRRWYLLKKNLLAETVSRQKDNELHRMKMVFFTDISHELRTPLTLIRGTLEKVSHKDNYGISPRSARRLQDNVMRMGTLINQIMDLRRHDVEGFRLKVAEKDLSENIKNIRNAFIDYAKTKNVKLSLKSDSGNIYGWYDPEILEKVLFNLLSNALKFTPEKGGIEIRLQKVCPTGRSPLHTDRMTRFGEHVLCSVEDSGIGIPKDELPFIFDRYYQSTRMATRRIPGTGVGMELVHKLIEKHKGAIAVESEEGKFTKFTFLLPTEKRHYKFSEITEGNDSQPGIEKIMDLPESIDIPFPDSSDSANEKAEGKNKILLVEDNVELRTMVKEELMEEGYIIEAENGNRGYEQAVKEKPELIISDILMPVENGISMLKRLKDNPETSHIPVFMLTAKDAHEIKIECLGLGADDFIEKPFSLEFIKWKVRNHLALRQRLRNKYRKVITAEPSDVAVLSNDEKFIGKLVGVIEEKMADKAMGVEFLASEVGMSRANLYRRLRAVANESPVNFIKKIRLKRAAQLLKTDSLYVSEIAYMTGFNSQKYFSKCFRKAYGMSPTDFAKCQGNEIPVGDF